MRACATHFACSLSIPRFSAVSSLLPFYQPFSSSSLFFKKKSIIYIYFISYRTFYLRCLGNCCKCLVRCAVWWVKAYNMHTHTHIIYIIWREKNSSTILGVCIQPKFFFAAREIKFYLKIKRRINWYFQKLCKLQIGLVFFYSLVLQTVAGTIESERDQAPVCVCVDEWRTR